MNNTQEILQSLNIQEVIKQAQSTRQAIKSIYLDWEKKEVKEVVTQSTGGMTSSGFAAASSEKTTDIYLPILKIDFR